MTKQEVREFIENELPYRMLMRLYEDSRASLRELGRDFGISHHVINSTLRKLEERYGLAYTLDLDETKLGFTKGRIITINFGNKPGVDFIKGRLEKDSFVQNAYFAEGDFDLFMHVVGLTAQDFQVWQWKFRSELSEYKPLLRFATANNNVFGFLPLRNELIRESVMLSATEKRILALLNENSRMKLKDLASRTRSSPNRVLYVIRKLRRTGVIKRFSALTQRPDKKNILAYGVSLLPLKEAEHGELAKSFARELLKEDLHESVNDYALALETNGAWDTVRVCAFSEGETLLRRGPELFRTLLQKEEPKIEKAMLTGIVVGRWPFHLERYDRYRQIYGLP
jgi:DNA-binding Lrp family transcriptional regulator